MLSFNCIHNEKKVKTILAKLKSLANLSYHKIIRMIVCTVYDIAGDLCIQKCADEK